jgi:hypothetical protein
LEGIRLRITPLALLAVSIGATFPAVPAFANDCVKTVRFDRTFPEFRAHEGLESFELKLMKRATHGEDLDLEPGIQSGIVASYSTDRVERLKDFVIVQYIRGCVFNILRTGERVTKHVGVAREWMDQETRRPDQGLREFRHVDWDFDSTDLDPVYATIPGRKRHDGYQVTEPDPFDPSTRLYAYQHRPSEARLFVSDELKDVQKPVNWDKALNSSLEFSTRLYYEKDVPKRGGHIRPNSYIAELDWNVRYQWSFHARRFVAVSAIDPFCLGHEVTAEMSLEEYEAELRTRLAGPEVCLPD